MSRRTVQLAVAECYGTTFSAMERTARLQRVRHALRATGGAETAAKIAYRHAFWHLGRFAQHYRALFGVLPSMDIGGRPAADGPANRRAK